MINLKAAPFYLDEQGCNWVNDILSKMTQKEKVGQLFCEILWDKEGANTNDIFKEITPGAVMYRPFSGKRMHEISNELQTQSKIPLLIACNLERGGSGGNGGLTDGTYVASPMGVAATNEREQSKHLGLIASREGAATGVNWTFEPIIDIDVNPENPITNVRTYGSNVDTVIEMAKGYMDGCKENNMAVTIKHFPGDGVDYRDQHLMASINSLSAEEWYGSFGKVYQTLIDYGAHTVMSAHIKQPALSKEVNPDIKDEDIMPSSLSYELNEGILRKKMSFNGVIVTDATQMVGFTCSMERSKAVPAAIANGCDMFLFTINHKEDVEYMLNGVRDGIITKERLDEAVTRILALKASLNLHTKQQKGTLVPPQESLSVVQCDEHIQWAKECADKSITLVKNTGDILPLTTQKFKRIELIVVTNEDSKDQYPNEVKQFKSLLEEAGFEVSYFADVQHPGANRSISDYKKNTDLIIYYANMKVSSNQTTIRITWDDFLGDDAPKYVKDIPTMFVSFSNPYHLVDVPMIETYINAYSSNSFTVEAVIKKIFGQSEFKGVSPVDPFAALWDSRL